MQENYQKGKQVKSINLLKNSSLITGQGPGGDVMAGGVRGAHLENPGLNGILNLGKGNGSAGPRFAGL